LEADLKISVVVPAFNEEKLITGSLAAIRAAMTAFTDKGWAGELIVCDNNSTDRTAELARAAGAAVVFEPVNQIARARNCGAAAATGDWLVFVDADSYPSRELFADVAATIETGTCIFGGSFGKLDSKKFVARVVMVIWNTISRVCKWAAGSFIFCETAAFRKVGGFSNELFAGEELDLSKRFKKLARASGKRVVILRGHPLVTSPRRLRNYTAGELLRQTMSAILRPQRFMRSREACDMWYDGRR
jgi:glycosyltransferase involved in cell wall biosynthesis